MIWGARPPYLEERSLLRSGNLGVGDIIVPVVTALSEVVPQSREMSRDVEVRPRPE